MVKCGFTISVILRQMPEGFTSLHMANILFIDDDPMTLEMLTKVAEISGHSALTAHSAAEGVRIASGRKPDLIILDMNLPDVPGLWLLKALKKIKGTKNIPAMVLSAGPEADAADLVKQAGALEYLEKPLRFEKLIEVIRTYA